MKLYYLLKILVITSGILFIICIPLFLLCSNLRFAANSIRLYEYGFDKYNVSEATGFDNEELRIIAKEMISYYNSGEEPLDVDVFNQREIAHMKDVKSLIRFDYWVQLASLGYIILYIVINLVCKRYLFLQFIAKRMVWGSLSTVALLGIIALWAVIGFDGLFLWFHEVSFSNDLWRLPSGGNMLLMFPEEFFRDAAIFVTVATMLEAIVVTGIAWIILRMTHRQNRGA